MSCRSEQCRHGSKEHLNKNVCQANLRQFSRSQFEMSIMNPAYSEQIGYTDSYDPLCISDFISKAIIGKTVMATLCSSPFGKQSTSFVNNLV